MTSLKANELWGVKVKPTSFSALCGYQSSRHSAALWSNMEMMQYSKAMKNLDTPYQQLSLRPKMPGQLGVFSYFWRFTKYWRSRIFELKKDV